MTFAIVQTSSGNYVAVVYDSVTSGTSGSVTVDVSDSLEVSGGLVPLALENDSGEGSASYPGAMTFSFPAGTTDGFMVGPITTETMVCYRHTASSNMNGARFMNGDLSTTTLISDATTLMQSPICFLVPAYP